MMKELNNYSSCGHTEAKTDQHFAKSEAKETTHMSSTDLIPVCKDDKMCDCRNYSLQ